MLAIEFGFPAGRFHANPWGRNVNEGVVEWPPSPFRLARALVDICKRRRPNWDDERLSEILGVLETPPSFILPPASTSHTRSFLSSNTKDTTKKQKIFDAFVVLEKNERVLAVFDCEVDDQLRGDLDELLGEMNYLGRSESWITARLVDSDNTTSFNCFPATTSQTQGTGEMVRVACLLDRSEYGSLSNPPTVKIGKGKKATEEPLSWLSAMSMSTKDLLGAGWSTPPAQKMVDYFRPARALESKVHRRRRSLTSSFTVAKYSLHSSVLPRVVDTVPFAERIRTHLMGIHRKVCGGESSAVSPLFSGKAQDGGPAKNHEHAFIFPLDENGDGRLDHVLVKVAQPFEASELDALDRFRSVWQPNGRPDVDLVLVSLLSKTPKKLSERWVSATPFVTKRHHRKGRGDYLDWLAEEVRRECSFHNLPEPTSISWTDRTAVTGHQYRWLEFVRSRKGQKPMQGHGCILEFDEPVSGPFAIGALAHFGLGLFTPWDPKE